MCLLVVSNDINHHGNFKGKSRVTRCVNSKSRITLLDQITPHEANLGPITYYADNVGSITRHGTLVYQTSARKVHPKALFHSKFEITDFKKKI